LEWSVVMAAPCEGWPVSSLGRHPAIRRRRHGLVQRRAAGRMGFYRLTDGNTQPALAEALGQLQELARHRPLGDRHQPEPD
jgi:hypothetical protein